MRMKYKPKETIQSLSRKVDDAIERTLDSDQFKEFLKTMAKFHRYSFHNQMLILFQKREATRVAGYRAWQEKFNRHVKHGAQSIAIFGHPKILKREVELDDGAIEIEERTWWPIVHVFDISDTEGDSLPDLDRTHVADNSHHAARLFDSLVTVIKKSDIEYVEVGQVEGTLTNSNALGAYSPSKREIQLVTDRGASRGELFKTAAHEYGHATYGNRDHEGYSHAFEECVVETSAMIVSSRFGLNLAPYDVSYVAGWSKGDRTLYKSGLEKATRLASVIIDEIEQINRKEE